MAKPIVAEKPAPETESPPAVKQPKKKWLGPAWYQKMKAKGFNAGILMVIVLFSLIVVVIIISPFLLR